MACVCLVDDKAYQFMSDNIVELGVADIFIEDAPVVNSSGNDSDRERNVSDFEDELVDMQEKMSKDDCVEVMTEENPSRRRQQSREEVEKQIKRLQEFYRSPSKKGKEVIVAMPSNKDDVSAESEDSDYMPGDDCSSEEDDEAADILRKFRAFKKKLRNGEMATLDDVLLGSQASKGAQEEVESEGYDTPYLESNDEDSVDELGSDGELRQKKEHYRRFKSSDDVPKFELGLKFSGKKEFKEAIIRYCLHERKVTNFIKDEPTRVRAKCDWAHCPWVCLCSRNSRTTSWQVATFKDEHTYPPRRDNKLVTARRIAAKYEKFIMANPGWNFAQMKNTVLEEMFADTSISKLKRAKAIVMQKAYDATKGQYEVLYDYQLELLRSNPGSTVVINKLTDVDPPTF